MAVVKSEAYGHGAIPVARQLRKEGSRPSGWPAWRRASPCGATVFWGKSGVGLHRPGPGPAAAAVAPDPGGGGRRPRGGSGRPGVTLKVHLALDTGMHRLGIPARDHGAIRRMYRLPRLKITGTFSHLCVSDSLAPGTRNIPAGSWSCFTRPWTGCGAMAVPRGRPISRPATASGICRPSGAPGPGPASPSTGWAATTPPPGGSWICARCSPEGPGGLGPEFWSRARGRATAWFFGRTPPESWPQVTIGYADGLPDPCPNTGAGYSSMANGVPWWAGCAWTSCWWM